MGSKLHLRSSIESDAELKELKFGSSGTNVTNISFDNNIVNTLAVTSSAIDPKEVNGKDVSDNKRPAKRVSSRLRNNLNSNGSVPTPPVVVLSASSVVNSPKKRKLEASNIGSSFSSNNNSSSSHPSPLSATFIHSQSIPIEPSNHNTHSPLHPIAQNPSHNALLQDAQELLDVFNASIESDSSLSSFASSSSLSGDISDSSTAASPQRRRARPIRGTFSNKLSKSFFSNGANSSKKKPQLVNPFCGRNSALALLENEELVREVEMMRIKPAVEEVKKIPQGIGSSPSKKMLPESHDHCSSCLETGIVICCDTCPRVFHVDCIASPSTNDSSSTLKDDTWQCRACVVQYGRIGGDGIAGAKREIRELKWVEGEILNGEEGGEREDLAEENSVKSSQPDTKYPLFQALFDQMDGLNPRIFELNATVRDQFQNVITHPVTGSYIDTRHVKIFKSDNPHSSTSTNRSRTRQQALGGGFLISPPRTASNHFSSDFISGGSLTDLKISSLDTCFKCGKTNRLLTFINVETSPRPTDLIKCDYCSMHWHLDCLDPPLVSVPLALRKDEYGPIDTYAISQLKASLWGNARHAYCKDPLAPRLYSIPNILGDRPNGSEYTATDMHLVALADPNSDVFRNERYIIIRPKWMCPLHVDWENNVDKREKWAEGGWEEYEFGDRGGKKKRTARKKEIGVMDFEKKEQQRKMELAELKKEGLLDIDLDPATLAIYEGHSGASIEEKKVLLEFTDRVAFRAFQSSVEARKKKRNARLGGLKSGPSSEMFVDENFDSAQEPCPSLSLDLMDNARISLRPDISQKFQEFGSEWSDSKIQGLHSATSVPDKKRLVPLVDHVVDQEAQIIPTGMQEMAGALLLFQIELQSRFIERHLGEDQGNDSLP